ncbi:hypothetical protein DICPUDRAFT_98331 [Dictyostelium purpureum]|uniref:Pesticidal crystal protein N-terminal domain-containing protein n=1 Tax=Dictyostelium purpureum TaxID=5786 RepID=F0ZPL0_DICPU|nr:uncharacterized protein DICPUDRAFT_98331 [Dictyostelium purpureum]EGC34103.1 hypothetical protein DICPUDRAFT_98331 [Dictyostelium purpureum]|eukprot:XP_003289349.1 hypothetical protein DICPUDRAFT_98331 [Dictyostelium purpureum]
MIVNTPINQNQYIKLLEDYIENPSIFNNKDNKIPFNTPKNNLCLFDIHVDEWKNLISDIININPESNKNNDIDFGFNFMWGKLFLNNKHYITKELFVRNMEKLYKDIEMGLGEELEKSAVEWLNKKLSGIHNCGNHFNDLLVIYMNKQCKVYGKKSNLLNKYQPKPLLEKYLMLSDEQLKSTIIQQFNSFKSLLEETILFSSSKMHSHLFGNLLSILMLIYSTAMRDSIHYGLSWGLSKDLLEYNEELDQDNNTLKEQLHRSIMDFHKNIGECCNKFCLSAIRPATTIIPWMNLPFNSHNIYGRINELDLVQYPSPVQRLGDEYGSTIVNCQDEKGVVKTFKVPPHFFNKSHGSGHIDCVSGFNPVWETFHTIGDFINFNIIRDGGSKPINSYSIRLHLSSLYEGDSYLRVKVGSSDVQTINTKDLDKNLTSFQVMNFKMLYNINLPYGTSQLEGNNLNNQRILDFKIFDICNVVINSIDITLE